MGKQHRQSNKQTSPGISPRQTKQEQKLEHAHNGKPDFKSAFQEQELITTIYVPF